MLQFICKLSPFAKDMTGFIPFANGLTFQAVCKRPAPFVTRLGAKDRFRLCVDLASLSTSRTICRPCMCMCKSPEILLSFCCYERSARRRKREQKYKVNNWVKWISGHDRTAGQPLSPLGLTNIQWRNFPKNHCGAQRLGRLAKRAPLIFWRWYHVLTPFLCQLDEQKALFVILLSS